MSQLVYEVEVKLPIQDADAWAARLDDVAPMLAADVETDTYYAHPQRDFASTDEALRLRDRGGRTELTYKGPREDRAAKVRREWNAAVEGPAANILEALGFQPVATVRKHRRSWQIEDCTVTLDDVDQVGTYMEIEAVGPDAGAAEATVGRVVQSLGVAGITPERRSYLELQLSS